jgi:PAS domain S-box-containing protein
VLKANGSVAYVIDQGTIIRDETGKALHALGSWTDITRERERENALENALQRQRTLNEELQTREEELAASEEELRQINEQLIATLDETINREFILKQAQRIAKIGSWEYQKSTQSYLWSEELYSIYGLEPKFDINNPDLSIVLFGEQGRALNQCINKLFLDGTPIDLTLQAKTPLGYKKWVRMVGFPITDELGSITGMRGVTHDITHFKESETRLRTSEEKFSKAFTNNPDLMTIHRESDLVIIDANYRVESVLGYTREDVIGRPASDLSLFVIPGDRERFFDMYFKNGNAQMETVWRRKDGTHVFILLACSRIEIDGEWYSLNVIEDISQRKAAEERFIKAFELSPDLMLIFRERDWVLMEVNSKLESLGGYNRDEVLGRASIDFKLWANEEDRKEFFLQLMHAETAATEAPLLAKGNRIFYAAISAQRIQLSGENHVLIVIRDVTEKRLAEERIRQSEANITATVNNTSLMVWSVDRDFRVMTYNRALADFIKTQYGNEIKQGERVIPETSMSDESKRLRQSWNGRYLRALAGETFQISTQAGELFFDFSLSPIIVGNQIIGVSIFGEDITQRKKDESQLADANKQVGEMRLMALRSVMNPHFIFNALNSIQYFIAQNDRKNAISYLSTFSKLIRGILTNSVNNKIKLAEELEQLRHYINLELVRFDNKFRYDIYIDSHVDVESIEIPSLLIQPYVENAILHGLYNKKGEGVLKITVTEQSNAVVVEIEDDGIGRPAALALRQQNFPRHKSMGTALTEERLKLINEKDNVAVETIDLLHPDNTAAGTKVRIRVRI